MSTKFRLLPNIPQLQVSSFKSSSADPVYFPIEREIKSILSLIFCGKYLLILCSFNMMAKSKSIWWQEES